MDKLLKEIDRINKEYNKYFVSYVKNYVNGHQQAEQFKIVSMLKNVPTTESMNSIVVNK